MGAWLATREQIMSALDVKGTARDNDQIDRLIESWSAAVVRRLNYKNLAPTLDTRYFDWPNNQMGVSWRLWLDANALISDEDSTTVTVQNGAVTLADGSFFVEPKNYGPPYTNVQINLSGSAAFSSGLTYQRAIGITGLFGYTDDSTGVLGTTSGTFAIDDTLVNFPGDAVGVGTVLRINDERVIVTDRNMTDTGLTVVGDLAASAAASLVVASATGILAGEVLLVDAEQMLVTDVAGTSLIVKRAWGGSTLAAHTSGVSIYSQRAFTVARGQLGTVAAEHDNGSTWSAWIVPGPANTLCIAEVLNAFEQEQSGYARSVGSGESSRNASGAGIEDARQTAFDAMGRHGRQRAV